MQHKTTRLAIAVALALAAGAVHAQQHQQFGRDSVYAVPGASSNGAGQSHTAPSNDPSAAGSVSTGGPVPRYGRDSVYVSQMPESTARASATAPGPQRFGRDSLYAGPFQSRPVSNESAVGSNDNRGKGG
jgi:hypothetical protein